MKTMKSIILCVLLLLATSSATAQEEVFKKYSDTKGVTTVYVSKSMFNIISSSTFNVGKFHMYGIMGKIDSMNVLECENKALKPKIWKEVSDYCEKKKFELMMNVNDSGEKSNIYYKQLKNNKNVLILLTSEDDELDVVNITGSLTLNDVKKIVSQNAR